MKWIIAYVAAAIAFGVLDSFWLRWAGPNLYRPIIGEILADSFRMGPALAFYFIYIGGMVYFGIKPGIESGQVLTAALNGAILGFVCYATFDLTSQAVMKVWSTQISIADIAWGTFATGTASAVAAWVTLKFTG
ncbi:DUF2177 family protein [Aurantiacibacter marinus]|uniref:Membrane protein n=1 Tax=Aurantiacibacter marinus TaxID=874156 RepID=A0A0H0XPG6_9SPHN|nr:DUF2177 family protein [Aurantiacibacter marinus]KLI63797.1 membrane protein [Aurantiacibacter marinus]